MPHLIKIAVTDDQVLFRESLVANLNSFDNMQVMMQAGNGKELLDQLNAVAEKPDIILLDLNMPVMNGVETTKQLRSVFPDLKIIILSIHDEEKYVISMVQLGVNGYLAKNAELNEVKICIAEVFEKGFYFNDAVMKILQSGALKKVTNKTKITFEPLFSERELAVLELICRQKTGEEIAEKLFVTDKTVDFHRKSLFEKTKARNVAGLVVYAIKNNLFNVDDIAET